ncbi:MAG: dTMP kinase [Armatimonadota bacterium]
MPPATHPLPRAPFITFEGIEGSGKTTLSQWLAEWLRAQGVPALLTCEPGGSELGLALRHALLQTHPDPKTELFLFLADRAHHVQAIILPALQQGTWVISDRYADSTLAYQGYGRGLDIETLRQLNQFATEGLTPDLTFLIDLPVEHALARTTQPNRFEREERAFHQRVREGYLQIAQHEPERFITLDGMQPLEALQRAVQDAVWSRFGDRLSVRRSE